LKLGSEGFCQRLLTSLILGAPYPRWEHALADLEAHKRLGNLITLTPQSG